jgi:hypothetical protein
MYLGIRSYIVFLLLGGWATLSSQGLSHQVIVPLAGLVKTEKLHYSQTVGEAAIEVFGCSDYVFTQGFQQPGIRLKTENPPPGNGVKVYPNPVSDFVTIELFGTGSRTFVIDFFNISGIMIHTEKYEFNDNYWLCQPFSVEKYSRGMFFIRILSTDGVINRTFKIEKL